MASIANTSRQIIPPVVQGSTSAPLWKKALAISAIGITLFAAVASFYGTSAGLVCLGIYTCISVIYLYISSRTQTTENLAIVGEPQTIQQITSIHEHGIVPIEAPTQVREALTQISQLEISPRITLSEEERAASREGKRRTQNRPIRRKGTNRSSSSSSCSTHYVETTDGRLLEYTPSAQHNLPVQCVRNAFEKILREGFVLGEENVLLNLFDSKVTQSNNSEDIINTVKNILESRLPKTEFYNECINFILNYVKGKYLEEIILAKRNLSPEQIALHVAVAKKQDFETEQYFVSLLETYEEGLDILEDLSPNCPNDPTASKTIWNVYELFICYLNFEGADKSQPQHPISRNVLLEKTVKDKGCAILKITLEQWDEIISTNNGPLRKALFLEYIDPLHLARINSHPEFPTYEVENVI